MIRSMTAYGRGEYQEGTTLCIAEIRSVNHRYRDIVMRLPKNYQVLEEELRGTVSSRIGRGRVEVSIQVDNGQKETLYQLELNVPLVRSYLRLFSEMEEEFALRQEVRLETLLQMKDIILYKPEPVDAEKVRPGFQAALMRALESLDVMRQKEGKAIEEDFLKRVQCMENSLHEISLRSPQLVEQYRERLRENINSLLKDQAVDDFRIAQEVALFAERSDITEEIVRIRSHLNQFREYLLAEEALGRRLDFLIQEIHREVNTVSAKASDFHISKAVVELKAELEKLREQVQNVE